MSLGPLLRTAIGLVALVAVVFFLVYLAWIRSKARKVGTHGVIQRSRLTCPKCGREFDYDWIPGASFSAVRLGPRRYMACPICHKWSVFPIVDTLVERPSPGEKPLS
jgi:hypothetical protein